MHMFFVGVAKAGRPFSVEERQHFIDTVRSEVLFSAHITRVVHVAPTPDSIVVGISNEPEGGWHETWRRHTFLCGYCLDTTKLARLDAIPTLAEEASQVAGRFSVLVVDRLRGRFALATQPARIDSIFTAENDRFVFFGNQASVLSALRDGAVRYAPGQLISFLNSGFFAHEDTPYEGVRCVNAYTTIQCVGGRITQNKICLSTLKTSEGDEEVSSQRLEATNSSPVLPEQMLSDFVRAFSPIKPTYFELGMTGGMDSRLVLAGAVAAGVDLECYTCAYGDSNRADLWVARRVAQLANVRHYTLETPRFMLEGATPFVKLRQTALWTLSATDGMLGCQYPVEPFYVHSGTRNLDGAGGEILRGGYGERIAKPTKTQVVAHMQRLWNHSAELFHSDLVAEESDRIHAFVKSFPAWVSAADLFDLLYLDARCGRWTAAATSASSSRIHPLLDNVVVRHAFKIPRRARRHHLVHRQLIERLLPAAKDFPLADKFWHGTTPGEREALHRTWPQAFGAPKGTQDHTRSTLPAAEIAAIKEYVIDSGRLSLFAHVLNVDGVRTYLTQPLPDYRLHDRFLKSLFSAAVLLSEPWRDLRYVAVEHQPWLGIRRPTLS